ncbi:MAG: hypothetical protein F7C35_08825 [Desulfurococcales archaeon]|nr:hypothetical protein [Desulfurococcales archaeon]
MEEAVVEAVVLVSLIAIVTLIAGYFSSATYFLVKEVEYQDANLVKGQILWGVGEACHYIFDVGGKPPAYNSASFTIHVTKRVTLLTRQGLIEINPGPRGPQTTITLEELAAACESASGIQQVQVQIVPGELQRGYSITVQVQGDPTTGSLVIHVGG